MNTLLRTSILPIVAAAMAVAAMPARADTVQLSATYYTIAAGDQDMGHLATGVFGNEVQNGLGPNGLPVLNTAAYGCTLGCFTNTPFPADVTAGGEITWWSPGLNANVSYTSTGLVTLPYDNGSFFVPNGTGSNNANGFQAAVFSTTLNVPTAESISFNIGADDVAFVYLNGSLVCSLGGVHANSAGTCTSSTLAAGPNSLQLFYADLERTQASLTFDITTEGISGTPPVAVSEPPAFLLFVLGLLALGPMAWRRRKA